MGGRHRSQGSVGSGARHKLADDVWELYNVDEDFSETNDLAASNPAKLKEMQALFMKEAERYRVLPIDDRSIERFDAAIAGRPDLMAGRKSLTVYEGMTGMAENAFINVKNQSKTITADVEVPAGANGVILCQGGRFGGWSLYVVTASRPTPTTMWVFISTPSMPPSGSHRARRPSSWISPTMAGRGKGGTATLFINGKKVGSGRVEHTNANIFSADDAADVGVDEGTNVSSAYKQHGNKFTGKIMKVKVDVM